MKILNKKLCRDIKQNLSQFITIFLMVFIGIMAYSGIEGYMEGMQETADKFYGNYNLQDLNVLGEINESKIEDIKNIDNVKNVEGKLVINTILEENSDVTLQASFIDSNEISKFYIVDGKEFNKDTKGIWVDQFYAEANNLKVGDNLKIKYDGYVFDEEIIGLINVPDHVYDVKDESQIYPDHKMFGFVYMSTNELEGYIKKQVMKEANITDEEIFNTYFKDFNYRDYLKYNYAMVDVEDVNELSKVKNSIEDKMENVTIIDIKDTSSYSQYQGEVDEGKTYIGVFSGLFLFIAILSVITTMTRVVQKQRIQIGTLKALGFKKRKIVKHYIGYSFWISIIAAICGLFAGRYFIGDVFINLEMSFFEIPNGMAIIKKDSFIVAAAVVLVVSFVTYLTTRNILKENTAETLRNSIPKVKKKSLNITTKGIFKKMNFSTKWNIRDIIRNKARTITAIVGVTCCCMLIVCAIGMLNSMDYFIGLQFNTIYNFDYKLSLKSNISAENLNKLTDEYGNSTSESLYIEIKDNNDERESNNIFVTDAKDYVRFTDADDEFINLRDDGVYVTKKLAENKGYKIGDKIKWHIYGNDKYYETEIVGFDRDPQNQNVKMTRSFLEKLGLEYKEDTIYTNTDLSDIKEIDGIEIIQNKAMLEEGMSNMLNTMQTMIILLIVVAAVLGSVILYNLGILSFTEKQYQFATLKVLGFKTKQIKKIYVKQNNWLTYVSIIIGLPLGYVLTDTIFKMALSEGFDMQAHIKVLSYIYAAIGTMVVSFITSHILARKVKKIDMVTSLKGNE